MKLPISLNACASFKLGGGRVMAAATSDVGGIYVLTTIQFFSRVFGSLELGL